MTTVKPVPTSIECFAATRAEVAEARHLPGDVYVCPEVLELERQKLFMRDWLCLAREEEIGQPGDYMTFRLLDEPIVLARDLEGRLNAFSNVCLHRGVEVAQGHGNRRSFSCPYHGWTYDLTGRLRGAPFMKDSEALLGRSCRLRPIRWAAWAGWIFVTFSDEAPPLADYTAEFQRELGFLRQEECRLADKLELELACNWKFVVENLLDIYHVHVLHAKSFGKNREPIDYLKNRDSLIGFYRAPPMVDEGKTRFGNMPWLRDRPGDFAAMGHLDPNMQLFARSDGVHNITIWPLATNRTHIIIYTLFPAEHFQRPNFAEDVKAYRDYWSLVVEEDRSMIHSLQRAMSSSRFEPGPMSLMEHGVHRHINRYLDRIFGR